MHNDINKLIEELKVYAGALHILPGVKHIGDNILYILSRYQPSPSRRPTGQTRDDNRA